MIIILQKKLVFTFHQQNYCDRNDSNHSNMCLSNKNEAHVTLNNYLNNEAIVKSIAERCFLTGNTIELTCGIHPPLLIMWGLNSFKYDTIMTWVLRINCGRNAFQFLTASNCKGTQISPGGPYCKTSLLSECQSHVPKSLQWRHNERDGVSNHQPHDCLLNRLFKAQIIENIKAPRHCPWCGKFTGDRWIPRTKGQ